MTLADRALRLAQTPDNWLRSKLVWEFLEEYRWEPGDQLPSLLQDDPPATGDERWDTLLAALTKHLAAQHDLAPDRADLRILRRPWLPTELAGGPMPWSGRRPPSASMAFACPPGTAGRVTGRDDVVLAKAELDWTKCQQHDHLRRGLGILESL